MEKALAVCAEIWHNFFISNGRASLRRIVPPAEMEALFLPKFVFM